MTCKKIYLKNIQAKLNTIKLISLKIIKWIHNLGVVFFLKKLFRKTPSKYLAPKKAYNLIASTYNTKEFNLFHFIDEKILTHYFGHFELNNKCVLDFGCGTGWKIPMIKSFGASKILVSDISTEMLKHCTSKHKDIEVVELNGESNLNYPSNSIDIITCNLVIGYVKNIKALFKEWARVLKPNGTIVLTDVHHELNKNGRQRNFIVENANIIVDGFPYIENDIVNATKNSSLKIIEFKNHSVTQVYKNELPMKVYQNFMNKNISYSAVLTKI